MSKSEYSKYSGGRVYCNRLLKPISDQCRLTINLITHIARHSYTSLMMGIGKDINLFYVMTSLRHKHLETIQKYLQRFNLKKIDNVSKQLSDYIQSKKS
jgi:site-specific recombinase XerD